MKIYLLITLLGVFLTTLRLTSASLSSEKAKVSEYFSVSARTLRRFADRIWSRPITS